MLTSDEVVVPGRRYIIELRSEDPEQEPITFNVGSDTFANLLEAWRNFERRQGQRVDFVTFFVAASKTALKRAKPNA
jgi:hypothetical protein